MVRTAYIDATLGASGDMLLGALVDAGVALDALTEELGHLGLEGWRLEAAPVSRQGFAATKVDVVLEPNDARRTLQQILTLIERSSLPRADRAAASRVFTLLGEAEAAVHGRPIQESELHEVGALDAIIDIVGCVVGLRLLEVDDVTCSSISTGSGTIRSAHGTLPVPPPAVLEIAKRSGLPLNAARPDEPNTELVTPTAAALMGALATSTARPRMRVERIGVGAGRKDFHGWPNVVRLWVSEPSGSGLATRPVVLLEANVDDMIGEHVPFLETRLRAAGALDVWWSSVQMKKGRPGLQLTVIAAEQDAESLAGTLLTHSSTLGVRSTSVVRYEAEREVIEVQTSLGHAQVKVKRLPGRPPSVAAEFETARALAEQHGVPIASVYDLIEEAARAAIAGDAGDPPRG